MSHRAETEFGTIVGDLLADLERFRPGLPASATPAEVQAALLTRARLRIDELYSEYRVDEAPEPAALATDPQLQLYRREVEQILLPRYSVLAQRQNELERGRSVAWHGADLYNRASYAVIFFAIGLFVVWAPFIPLWDKWIPFALALIAPLCTPWLPDLYRSLLKHRHQLELALLHQDLDRIGHSLPLPPVGLLGRAAEATPRLPAAAQSQRRESALAAGTPDGQKPK